jgi:hypothetical protein
MSDIDGENSFFFFKKIGVSLGIISYVLSGRNGKIEEACAILRQA